jgi:hypothetical protein
MTREEFQVIHDAIARRREEKAAHIAFLAHACNIPADSLESAREHEWAQLTEAARANTGKNFGVPSVETRKLVIAKMREFEQKGVSAA